MKREAWAFLVAGILFPPVSVALAEWQVGDRWVSPPIFKRGPHGPALSPGARANARIPGGPSYRVVVDPRGWRAPSAADPDWIFVGDSMVFGPGVDGAQTMVGRLLEQQVAIANAGMPGASLADTLAHADGLVAEWPQAGILVGINGGDDLEQGDLRLGDRVELTHGWMVSSKAPGWARTFWTLRVAHVALAHESMRVAGALWSLGGPPPPDALSPAELGQRIRAWSQRHPDTPHRVVWFPGVSHAPGQVAELQAGLGQVPLLDLGPVLEQAASLRLGRDPHLSAGGHRQVAGAIKDWLADGS